MRYLCLGLLLVLLSFSTIYGAGTGPAVSADQALKILQEGNTRFIQGKVDHPNQDFMTRSKTYADGQAPFACVLSCSDSRVPVEILFDRGVGDVFVVRVAGNIANVNEIASIEYGIDHLNVPLLVVLGHSKCGAVTAVVQKAEAHGNIPYLIKSIVPAVETARKQNPHASGDSLVNDAIKANIWQAIADLYKNSPTVAEKVKNNKAKVIGAFYELETGKVTWMGEHPDQQKLLPASSAVKGH